MVVCGGGIITPAGGEVPEEVLTGSEHCDDSMGGEGSTTVSPSTMLAGGAAAETFSVCSTAEDDDDQMMLVDDDNCSHHLTQKFFCTTPMISARPSPVSTASSSPVSFSSAAVSMVTASGSNAISSLLEFPTAAATSFSPLLPNLGSFSGKSSYYELSVPLCPPSHHHHATPAPRIIDDPQRPQLLPLLPHQDLHTAILEAVALEPKYQPSLTLSMVPTNLHEISGRMRNGSCHVLRCLKVWYDLPCDTFFLAVNTMDRFLTRMRAQPKHLSCIAVSAFHVACEEMAALSGVAAPSRDSVSVISQSKCTSGDVQRMEDIIRTKLELQPAPCDTEQVERNGPGGQRDLPVTPLALLKLLYAGHCQLLAQHFPSQRPDVPPLLLLAHKLEVVVCDTRAANCRASSLALTLLRRELLAPFNGHAPDDATVAAHTACLQPLMTLCKVNASMISRCEQVMEFVLKNYDSPVKPSTALYHRQRLVWKLSNRTLRQLRPTDKLRRHQRLEPITEFVCPTFTRFQRGLTHWPQPSCGEDVTFEEDDDHDYSKDHFDFSQLPAVAGGWNVDESALLSEETDSDEECAEAMQGVGSGDMLIGSGCELRKQGAQWLEGLGEDGDADVAGEESMDTGEEDELRLVAASEVNFHDQKQLVCDREVSSEVVMEEVSADQQAAVQATAPASVPATHQQTAGSTASTTSLPSYSGCISNDKEESYSQVAKKMKEDVASGKSPKVGDVARRAASTLPPTTRLSPYNALQISPLSKITVTPAPPSSAVRRNLTSLLTAQSSEEDEDAAGISSSSASSYYSYHHRRVFGIVNLEHPEGGAMEEDQLPLAGSGSARYPITAKNAKRKKQLLKLQLVAQFRLDNSSDSEMPSEHASSSSEEEMDSDYEKEFPPLPLPRSPPHRRLTTTSTTAALLRPAPPSTAAPFIINKKNKKKSDVPSPYAAKTKAMRKMHVPRPMVAAQ